MNSSHKYYHPLVHIQNPPNPTPQIQAYLFSLDSLVDIKWKLFLEHVPGALSTASSNLEDSRMSDRLASFDDLDGMTHTFLPE